MKKFIISILALALIATPALAGNKRYKHGHNNNHNNGHNYWRGKNHNYWHGNKNNNNDNFYESPYFWGGIAGGLIGGAIINNNRRYYDAPEYEVPPLTCWYKHIQVWDEEIQQYILIKKQVCSQY
jgi:hypothetical protein